MLRVHRVAEDLKLNKAKIVESLDVIALLGSITGPRWDFSQKGGTASAPPTGYWTSAGHLDIQHEEVSNE